jgi:hypothetical protein
MRVTAETAVVAFFMALLIVMVAGARCGGNPKGTFYFPGPCDGLMEMGYVAQDPAGLDLARINGIDTPVVARVLRSDVQPGDCVEALVAQEWTLAARCPIASPVWSAPATHGTQPPVDPDLNGPCLRMLP